MFRDDENEEVATVVEVYDNGRVKVEMRQKETCGTCAAKSFCSVIAGGVRQLKAVDPIGVKVGQIVTLRHNPRTKAKAAVLLFFLPLLFLVAGFFIGNALAVKAGKGASSESWGIAVGMALFGLSFGILMLINRYMERGEKILPVIKEKIDACSE